LRNDNQNPEDSFVKRGSPQFQARAPFTPFSEALAQTIDWRSTALHFSTNPR
jgi:hypothetical protein